jgi:UDP-N-acetyl-D-glucosamine/UDP-N-acetyl-D-galactosamine dehydrogenase
VPDQRNSKVWDLIAELRAYGIEVFVHEPVAEPNEARQAYGIKLLAWVALPQADTIIVTVAHEPLLSKPHQAYISKLNQGGCFIDVKARLNSARLSATGFKEWRL